MRENPPKRCRRETENWRESVCRSRKRRRNNVDSYSTTVDADSDQQDGSQEMERGAHYIRGSRGAVPVERRVYFR